MEVLGSKSSVHFWQFLSYQKSLPIQDLRYYLVLNVPTFNWQLILCHRNQLNPIQTLRYRIILLRKRGVKIAIRDGLFKANPKLSYSRISENFDLSFVTLISVRFSVYIVCPPVLNLNHLKLHKELAVKNIFLQEK